MLNLIKTFNEKYVFLGIRNFNHTAGCQRCVVRGQCLNRTMSYPILNAALRTDDDFRSKKDSVHHVKYSVIEELLNFDVILDFPISDPLHLLHIGIMKRMLDRWIYGTKTYKRIFTNRILPQFDNLLTSANQNKPSEINRPIRNIKDFKRWKGTEHKTILMYVGIVILKDFIPSREYKMFLYLCCAVKLASVYSYPIENDQINLINDLLLYFIEDYAKEYGPHTISSNVHNLRHVSADLKRFGNINSVSTYPFENHLGKIKQKIRGYYKPLQQFVRRAGELEKSRTIKGQRSDMNVQSGIKLAFKKDNGSQTIFYKDFQLSSRKIGDSFFLTKSAGKIIKFKEAYQNRNGILIHGIEIPDKSNFFEFENYESRYNDIYISDGEEQDLIVCTADDIKCKLFRLPYKEMYVFQPLVHTLQE